MGKAASVSVLVDPKKMPKGQKRLPQAMEGIPDKSGRPWRHPVYGHSEDPWVTQESHPYFFKVVDKMGPAVHLAVKKVIRDIDREIT